MLPPIIRLVRMILLLGRVCVQFAFVMDLLVGFVILLRVRLRLQRPNLIFIPVLDLGCLFRSSRLLFCCCFVSGSTRLVCFAAFGTFFFLLVARLLHLIFRSRNFCFVVSSFVIGFVSSSRSFAFFVFRYSLLSKVGFVAKVWRGFLVIFKLVDMYYNPIISSWCTSFPQLEIFVRDTHHNPLTPHHVDPKLPSTSPAVVPDPRTHDLPVL
jgi:hypothetical protein